MITLKRGTEGTISVVGTQLAAPAGANQVHEASTNEIPFFAFRLSSLALFFPTLALRLSFFVFRLPSLVFRLSSFVLLAALCNSFIVASAADAPTVSVSSDVQDLIFLGVSRPLLVRLHVSIDGKPFREVWSNYLNRLFDEADDDGDGWLDKDEAARVPPLLAGDARSPTPALAANTEGKISREAFLAYFDKSEAAPFVARQGQGRTRSAAALFSLLDSDGNGQLSADELRAAASTLRKRDFDDDETITEEELAPGQSPYGDGPILFSATSRLPASGLVFTIQPSTQPSEVAETILHRYGRKGGAVPAQSLSPAESGLAPKVFAELDSNGDGQLSSEELANFAHREADIELRFSLGQARIGEDVGDAPAPEHPESPFAIQIRRRNYGYNVDVGDAQLEFRFKNSKPSKADRQSNQIPFEAFDGDNNGYIDEDEAKNNPLIASAFKAIDRDGDGKVTKTEFDSYFSRLNEAADTRLTFQVADQGRDLFDLLDTNQDGRLTLRELRAAPDVLKSHDTNHDGVLSGDEIPRGVRFELARGSGSANLFGASVGRGPPRRPPVRPDTAGPLWFRKMDRNHDGDLSRGEFLGSREDFDRLDTNHDGLIDAQEADAAGNSVER